MPSACRESRRQIVLVRPFRILPGPPAPNDRRDLQRDNNQVGFRRSDLAFSRLQILRKPCVRPRCFRRRFQKSPCEKFGRVDWRWADFSVCQSQTIAAPASLPTSECCPLWLSTGNVEGAFGVRQRARAHLAPERGTRPRAHTPASSARARDLVPQQHACTSPSSRTATSRSHAASDRWPHRGARL